MRWKDLSITSLAKLSKKNDKLLKLWQSRLRLNDWEIELNLVPSDTDSKEPYGRCDIEPCKKATINIFLSESNHIETTLVHELLHIYFDRIYFDDRSHEFKVFEDGLDMIADSLIRAYNKEQS